MKLKVLIIDDETDFCEIMRAYFVRKGYEVHLAFTCKDGMKLVHTLWPEILFLDNNLPDGQGWEHINEIVEIIPQSRVFLISAHKTGKDLDGNYPSNIKFWEKPISIKTLDLVF